MRGGKNLPLLTSPFSYSVLNNYVFPKTMLVVTDKQGQRGRKDSDSAVILDLGPNSVLQAQTLTSVWRLIILP